MVKCHPQGGHRHSSIPMVNCAFIVPIILPLALGMILVPRIYHLGVHYSRVGGSPSIPARASLDQLKSRQFRDSGVAWGMQKAAPALFGTEAAGVSLSCPHILPATHTSLQAGRSLSAPRVQLWGTPAPPNLGMAQRGNRNTGFGTTSCVTPAQTHTTDSPAQASTSERAPRTSASTAQTRDTYTQGSQGAARIEEKGAWG